jgi:ABC-type molybdate transport system substrate-binding protein
MASQRVLLSFLACTLFVSISHGTPRSAELKVFASRAIWTVLGEIGPEFEKNSGHKLNVITGLSSEFVGRINGGEAFDVIAAPPAALDGLTASGKAGRGFKDKCRAFRVWCRSSRRCAEGRH